MLKIDDLNFKYGEQEILKDINIYLRENEFIGIIGPNGSGKSTLLKNISQHLNPDKGSIYLNKRLLNDYSVTELARAMAVVPQDTAVNYNFNVYDLVMMGRNPYQDRWGRVEKEDREKVREALELTDTYRFKDKKINELSGGERQRVIVARALAQQPEILLLDEPTANLDINYQREVFDILSSLNNDLNLAILVVSHDLNLSSQYCDKLILLYQGQIHTVGNPEEVLTESNISKVYRTKVMVKENPLTGRPYVIMVPGKRGSKIFSTSIKEKNREDKVINNKENLDNKCLEIYQTDKSPNNFKIPSNIKVHIICGGGSGGKIMESLKEEGYNLSCGVVNKGDTDWQMAKKLGIETVEIAPFNPIDSKSKKRNLSLAKSSDIIILTETPFGHGNLANISVLTGIKNNPVILIAEKNIAERDYTGGKATEYWKHLIQQDNVYVLDDKCILQDEVKNMVTNRNS